jgi:hypothetical protein
VFTAIEDLSELNRRSPDARVEGKIVELRHAAFATLSRTPGRPEWPADFADPFPDDDGLPQIDGADLTGEVLGGAIVNHGCLRVNGLLADEEVARFLEHIHRTFDARQRIIDGAPLDSGSPWFVPFEPGREESEGFGTKGYIRTVDAPRALCDLVDLFASTGIQRAVTDYFSERPAMIAGKWALRRTSSGKIGTDFHQDGAFLGKGIRTVNCWITLSDCGPGTGRPAIDVIPRRFPGIIESHEGAAFPWSVTESAARDAANGVPVLSPTFAAGDAMFFDERLPHRTSVGLDLSTRDAIESWFVAPSSYQEKHVPVVL